MVALRTLFYFSKLQREVQNFKVDTSPTVKRHSYVTHFRDKFIYTVPITYIGLAINATSASIERSGSDLSIHTVFMLYVSLLLDFIGTIV